MIEWRALVGLKLPDPDGDDAAACGTAASPGMPNPNACEEPNVSQNPAGTATTDDEEQESGEVHSKRKKQPRAATAMSASAADVVPAAKKQRRKRDANANAVADAGADAGEIGTLLDESGPAQP